MADTKVTALGENTTVLSTDILYLVDDPGGAPASEKAAVLNVVDAGLKSVQSSANLIKNSPGQIVVDGAEPQWWDDVANATITDEDTAGEVPADIHARCFKVVTIADDVYGVQTLTFADEDLLDAGTTEVSLSCWVYCATGSKASIGIFGTNLTLQESSQAGAGAWTLLTVENKTLNAADASIEIRLIVDTDTAWFTMPMLNVGAVAMPWKPRGQKFVAIDRVDQVSATSGDVAWVNTDCTANTDPLATIIQVQIQVSEAGVSGNSWVAATHADAFTTSDTGIVLQYALVSGLSAVNTGVVMCDDSQNIRYSVGETDADADMTYKVRLCGYWMWE